MSSREDVRLRDWREDDIDAVVTAMNDPEIVRRMVFASPFTREHGRAFLERQMAGAGAYAVTDASDEVLGAVWVRDAGEGRGQIGYWTSPHARGRGAATEGLRRLVPRGFGLGYSRLQLLVDPGNVASVRVAEGAGFRREGVMRGWMELRGERLDLVMYALVPADVGRSAEDVASGP